jgi:hypothetical protein
MRMKGAGHAASKAEMRGAYIIFVRTPEGMRPLGRSTHTDGRMILQQILSIIQTKQRHI